MAPRRRPVTANTTRPASPPRSFTARLATFRQTHLFNDEPISYNTKNGQLHPPEWLAQQGLYYTPTSLKSRYTVTCSTCGTVISQPLLRSTDVARLHLQQSPQCSIARIWVFRSNNDREHEPVDAAFIPDVTAAQGVAVRESTFTNNGIWTHEFPDIDIMTQSGLYYDPLSERPQEDGTAILDDRVICMYCGLNLEEWERGDDVISAHRDANPACYVFRSKEELVPIQAPVSDSRYSPGVDFDVHMHDEDDDNDDGMPVQFDNADEYGDNDIPIRGLEGEDHSVVSIESATTTTTTTALPVEIVEVDEVEEYLLQDDRRDATSRDVRTVEIPSVKSSELSQFFTEMDLESEHEAGASYFAARKKQRTAESQHGLERTNLEPMVAEEDEKAHEEQPIAEQVEEIEEVEETEKEVAEQPEQTSVDEPAQLASDGKDDANDDDIDMNHNDFEVNSHDYGAFQQLIPQNDVIDVISQKDAEAAPSAAVDEDAILGGVATVVAYKVNGIIEANNVPDNDIATPAPTNKEDATAFTSDAHALEDVSKEVVAAPASVSDDTSNEEAELSRVKQLESELKLLKLQIEKLQNQSVPVISHILKPAESDLTRTEEPVVNNDVVESEREELKVADGPTEIETEDVVAEKKNEEASTEKSQNNTGNEIASEEVLEHEEMEVDQSSLVEMGIKIEEENPADACKTQTVIKEEKVDSQLLPPPLKKSNKNRTRKEKEKKKRGHDVEEVRDDDPLAFKPKKARHKKKKRSIRREKEVPAADDAETVIKIEPAIGLAADDAENTSRNETSEIPTEADQSKQDQRIEDVSNGEHFLQSGFVPGAHRVKKSNIEENYHDDDAEKENVNPTNFENDESYNDTSPTLLRKNAEGRTKEKGKEKHETKGLNDNSNLAFQLDLGLNLSHEYIANNQSTPYASNVRDALEMSSENPPVAPSIAATSGEKLGVSDIAPESTSWAPLDSSKCHTVYADVKEAVGYVKEVLESPYELLGEDLDGLLTEFVGAIPPEQLGMSVREWMRCQEEQAVALVEEKAELLQRQLHAARAAAEAYLETL